MVLLLGTLSLGCFGDPAPLPTQEDGVAGPGSETDTGTIYIGDALEDLMGTDENSGPGNADVIGDKGGDLPEGQSLSGDIDGPEAQGLSSDIDGADAGASADVPSAGDGDTSPSSEPCENGPLPDEEDQVGDGLDQNCDGVDGVDSDGDGYGDPDSELEACDMPSGMTDDHSDCNDGDEDVNPGAEEIWYDGVDSDCDEASDYDADSDGYDSDAYGGDDCDDDDASVVTCGGPTVSLGGYHSCSLDIDGSIFCWGADSAGQVSGAPTGDGYIALTGGTDFGCAIDATGAIECWGDDTYSQVSDVPTTGTYEGIIAHHENLHGPLAELGETPLQEMLGRLSDVQLLSEVTRRDAAAGVVFNCARTTSVGSIWTCWTPTVFCAVTSVKTLVP